MLVTSLAVENFVHYLSRHRQLKLEKTSSILFICDLNHFAIVKDTVEFMRPHYFSVEAWLIEKQQQLVEQLEQLSQFDAIILLYDNAAAEVSTPYGNLIFQPLVALMEADMKQTTKRRIFAAFDIADYFDEIYSHSLGFYENLHKAIIARLTKAKKMTFISHHGCVSASCDQASPWAHTEALEGSILPAEIAGFAADLSGEIAFQGAILGKLPFMQKHGLIEDDVILTLENARVIDYHTENRALQEDLDYYFSRCEDNKTICELGIGTNIGLSKLRPINAFAQERYAGFHLGFGGRSNQSMHLDFIFAQAEIECDGVALFKNRQFCL